MAATPERIAPKVADFEEKLSRSDVWMFGPLIAIVVAMPLAIVALTSVGLWFAAFHSDLTLQGSPKSDTFASRWVEPTKPETFLR